MIPVCPFSGPPSLSCLLCLTGKVEMEKGRIYYEIFTLYRSAQCNLLKSERQVVVAVVAVVVAVGGGAVAAAVVVVSRASPGSPSST